MASTGIDSLLTMISKGSGMASSNNFGVEILFFGGVTRQVGNQWSYRDEAASDATRMMIFCDEVSLPGYQSGTGQVSRLTGDAQVYYPTTPIYNDIQLSFMCDAYMTPLHKLNTWMRYIFDDENSNEDGVERGTRLRYPDQYQAKIKIYKTERSAKSDNGAISTTYTLHDAWPYSIDSTPLSYGSSQLVKITANFYYRRWTIGKSSLEGRQKK